jgi:hypothetical protein
VEELAEHATLGLLVGHALAASGAGIGAAVLLEAGKGGHQAGRALRGRTLVDGGQARGECPGTTNSAACIIGSRGVAGGIGIGCLGIHQDGSLGVDVYVIV